MQGKWKDLLTRAAWTFVQAFLATVAVGLASVNSVDALQVLAVAGLAAGISALKTFVKESA